ncbi:hypothetical protein ACVWXN_001181 [Bradyrhizobium sp. i1.4.4]
MTNYLIVGLLASLLPAIAHADEPRVKDFTSKTTSSGFCVDYDKVGTRPDYLGLSNGCGDTVTVETVNKHSNGTIAASRTFHLFRDEIRKNIGLPGYSTEITSVSPWSKGISCEDGFGRMRVSEREQDGQTVFSVTNLDAQRFLAVDFRFYNNRVLQGYVEDVIPPGTKDVLAGSTTLKISISLEWSCLDPL